MPFSKSYPKQVKGSSYPHWEEVFLSPEEESEQENNCRIENLKMMDQCIEDAKKIFAKKQLKEYQSDLISVAVSLFEKRASHAVHWKENKSKEKFDKVNKIT